MKKPDYHQQDLTAHALGELDPAENAKMRRLIATRPDVRAEYERIGQCISALQQNNPGISRHGLSARQRETVLSLGQVPNPARPRQSMHHRMPWKLAAAACVAAGSFLLGLKMAPVVIHAPARVLNPEAPADSALAARSEVAPEKSAAMMTATSYANSENAKNSTASHEPVAATTSKPVRMKALESGITNTPRTTTADSLIAFTVATARPETKIVLEPKLMRLAAGPVPREFAGLTLASPLRDFSSADVPAPARRKDVAQPPLVIHSWKAETASCPWEPSRRLLRLVVQIPTDQEAVEISTRDYHLALKFDPACVKAWRLIAEKHMPPSNGGQFATRFAWYEIIPVDNFAPQPDRPAVLGALEVVQPHGAPHDGQPLKLVDRGITWKQAREDFVFESAMAGFNLLLQGAENIGGLDHKLVLDLADQSKDEDPRGERAKFISAVRLAQYAAGIPD